jgi:hydrogenase nickel incorporation protein HypA/HybF
VRCRSCGAETDVAVNRLVCGACSDWKVDVIGGEEMILKRVEVETSVSAVH